MIPAFAADYPGAVVFPAHEDNAYNPQAHGAPNRPRAFILHSPEEPADTYPATPHWFAQYHPQQRGSTHYFVAYTGDVYQCVPETWGAIANGLDGKPRPAWAGPESLNWQTLSVEIEGQAASIGQTLVVGGRQWRALVALVRHRCRHYGIPTDRAHLMGHYELSVQRTDPGAGFPWAAFLADVQEGRVYPADVQGGRVYTDKQIDDKVGAVLAAVVKVQQEVTQLRGEVQQTFALALRNQARLDALERKA